ncbi:hypothetical protein [Pseudoroseicyclus sp. CXY001]|uniref:hypothetical protein n=1 Tax=Pseudoroseicyclus sp. CXY001 TaxID=3242492 RepID=UPI0035710499
MPVNHISRPATALAALTAGLAFSSAAWADVTADDVWATWQEAISAYGDGMITMADPVRDGDTLTIDDISVEFEDDDVHVSADVGTIVLTENGDGSVSVTVPESYEMTFGQAANVDLNRAVISVSNAGLDMQVSGTPEEMTYTFSADSYDFALVELYDAGEPVEAEGTARLIGLSGSATMSEDEALQHVASDINADTLELFLDINDPGEVVANLAGQISNVALRQDTTTPLDMATTEPEEMFAAGFATDLAVSAGAGEMIYSWEDGSDTASGAYAAESSSLALTLNASEFALEEQANGVVFQLVSGSMPLPLDVSVAELGFSLGMPVSATEEPAEIGASLTIDQLALNEEIWMMADPAGALPHDPMTLIFKLSGVGKLLVDLSDPTAAMGMGNDMPGELYQLNLDQLTVKLVGASIEGTGAFTFDNSDLTTFQGMPRPEGEAVFNIEGLNALIGKLAEMGLVPQDQLMGARMMLGLFTESVGEDALQSTITVTPDGSVLANGQQLR